MITAPGTAAGSNAPPEQLIKSRNRPGPQQMSGILLIACMLLGSPPGFGQTWRSTLYPVNWKPGYEDNSGRYLQDFSYAGYHRGEADIPVVGRNVTDATGPPFYADNTGTGDATAAIQQALDAVGSAGGGVVYLPPGRYRIRVPEGENQALRIRYDSTVLRGAGTDSTFIYHDGTFLRQKDIIRVTGNWAGWFDERGTMTLITADLTRPTRILPVESVGGFAAGDLVVVRSTATEEFMAEHGMAGIWTPEAIKGVAFLREIDSVDGYNSLLILDAPTRYALKTRDQARVYHAGKHLRECGIEDLSIGNLENPRDGWDEESYTTEGTGAWDVHFSHAIRIQFGLDCWIRNVNTYRPVENAGDVHLLSNGILLDQCRNVTIDSCFFQKPQYEGGGGNGYMYTLQSNDCLINNCRANDSRHNFDFKYPFSNGNVIHNCRGENSKYSSDFHMYLSMSNLIDDFTVNGDYLESTFRPWGGEAIHGYSSTQSVFYNTRGEAYHVSRDYIVESRQFGWGYVIGTSGPAYKVLTGPVAGTAGGYPFDTSPADFTEGIGTGKDLVPESLYLDQFRKRMDRAARRYRVRVQVRDAESGDSLPGSQVRIYHEATLTDSSGSALFRDMYPGLVISVEHGSFLPLIKRQYLIYSDTTLVVFLERPEVSVTFRLSDDSTGERFWGARVYFNDRTGVTDAGGEVDFRVKTGSYGYLIEKVNYRKDSGTIGVISDTLLDFPLSRTHADLKFILDNDGTPMIGAVVQVNGESLFSSSIGMALFRGLPVHREYSYRIGRDGFSELEGEVYLWTDTTIQLEMVPIGLRSGMRAENENAVCRPNPAGDFITLDFPGIDAVYSIRLMDMTGREINRFRVRDVSCTMDIHRLRPGLYFLDIRSIENIFPLTFVKY